MSLFRARLTVYDLVNTEVTVIVDHLLSLHLGQGDEEDSKNLEYWRQGIAELAKLSHVRLDLVVIIRLIIRCILNYRCSHL
jgi:hypothetical protein